jgi:hypothetical protein
MTDVYTTFILLRATSAWLRLSHADRQRVGEAAFRHRFADMHVRYYDAEAFTAQCSDVLMVETPRLEDHRRLMDHLRDSPIFAHPYFELVAIIPATEDTYRDLTS